MLTRSLRSPDEHGHCDTIPSAAPETILSAAEEQLGESASTTISRQLDTLQPDTTRVVIGIAASGDRLILYDATDRTVYTTSPPADDADPQLHAVASGIDSATGAVQVLGPEAFAWTRPLLQPTAL